MPRRSVRRRLAWIVLAALAASCSLLAKAPPAVLPALDAIEDLGYRCDGGSKDNVPSGLYQWRCQRAVDGLSEWVLVWGNEQGIPEFDIDVEDTDPARVREAYAQLIERVPPLSREPALAAGLDGWTGPQAWREIGGVRVSGECDATQCLVEIVTAASPLQPLP